MSRLSEHLEKITLFLTIVIACAIAGWAAPLLLMKDEIAAALASEILAITGTIVGTVIAVVAIHKEFD